jgi:hypothetical protein
MTVLGGIRPPVPRTVGAGRELPLETTATVGDVISVVVRFAVEAPPGRNSATRPPTRTSSPTATVGDELVKTNIASDVASLPSGVAWK